MSASRSTSWSIGRQQLFFVFFRSLRFEPVIEDVGDQEPRSHAGGAQKRTSDGAVNMQEAAIDGAAYKGAQAGPDHMHSCFL